MHAVVLGCLLVLLFELQACLVDATCCHVSVNRYMFPCTYVQDGKASTQTDPNAAPSPKTLHLQPDHGQLLKEDKFSSLSKTSEQAEDVRVATQHPSTPLPTSAEQVKHLRCPDNCCQALCGQSG